MTACPKLAHPVAAFVAGDDGGFTVTDRDGRTEACLGAFLARLGATSPFYRERLAGQLDGGAVQRLGRLAPTTRADYRGPLAREALAGLGHESFVADRSSGSTAGPVLRFCRAVDDLAEQLETERVFRRSGLRPADHLVCIDVGAATIYDFYSRAARAIGVRRFTFLHLTEDDAAAWRALGRLEPTVVLTIPSLILRGGDRPWALWPPGAAPVRLWLSVGERLDPDLRHAARRAWGCAVHAFFGTTETGGFASECVYEDGCHFHPESTVVSLAQASLLDASTIEGELLLTTPSVRTQAVVKYQTGDRVRVSIAACRCGEPTPRLWPLGRTEEVFVLAGEKFTYDAFLEALRRVEPTLGACSILVGSRRERPVRLVVHLPLALQPRVLELHAALAEELFELDALCRYGMVEIELAFEARLPIGRRKGIRLATSD